MSLVRVLSCRCQVKNFKFNDVFMGMENRFNSLFIWRFKLKIKKDFCDHFGRNFGMYFVTFVKNLDALFVVLFFNFFNKRPRPINRPDRTSDLI